MILVLPCRRHTLAPGTKDHLSVQHSFVIPLYVLYSEDLLHGVQKGISYRRVSLLLSDLLTRLSSLQFLSLASNILPYLQDLHGSVSPSLILHYFPCLWLPLSPTSLFRSFPHTADCNTAASSSSPILYLLLTRFRGRKFSPGEQLV